MDEGQVVARLPLVADEQTAVTIVPAVGALYDPSPWFAASAAHQGLFTASANVRRHAAIPDLLLGVGVVVPLVQAEVVRTTRSSRASMNDSVERDTGHPLVVNVGGGQFDADRHAATVGQNVAFCAAFCAIGRIGARVVPPFGAFTVALSREHHLRSTPTRSS
jgi:hypothetical protein